MNNWLVGLSQHPPTDEELLHESIKGMTVTELQKLAHDVDPLSQPTQIDALKDKIFGAERHGRELAHERGELNKIAFIPALIAGASRLLPMAGRALAGGGAKKLVGGVAKDMAVSGAANKVMGALKPAAPAASAAGEVAGGFKYAFSGAGLLQRAAGYTVRNPGTALTAAGAIGGAALAPRDQQTGKKQYLRGAVMGGGAAAGVNALSNGAMANKMRAMTMNKSSPLLGQGTRSYLMDAAAASKGKLPVPGPIASRTGQTTYGKATPAPTTVPPAATAPVATSSPAATAATSKQPYVGGPVTGNVKVAARSFMNMSPAQQILFVASEWALEKKANQQTLTYDPASKTFTRQHVTPSAGSDDLKQMGAKPIPAGHREYVRSAGATPLSRTRPMGVPPPIPAAARRMSSLAGAMVR